MNLKYSLSTLLGVSTIGGITGVGVWYSSPKDLKDLLLKEGKQLLDVYGNTNDEAWKKLTDKYKGNDATITLKDDKQVNKIGTFRIDSADNDGFTKLKDKCKQLFEKKISDKEDFKTAKQDAINWCIKESNTFTKELKVVQSPPRAEANTEQTGISNSVVQPQTLNQVVSGGQRTTESGPAPSN